MKILLVEDDEEVNRYVARGLTEAGHNVHALTDGNDAFIEASHGSYDVWVVDRMLPGLDGLSMIKALRAMENRTPALILSALGEVDHRVEGLRAGSDDYLTKPFAFSELLARVEVLTRRVEQEAPSQVLQVENLEMDLLSRTVRRGQRQVDLLPREFSLLAYLMRHSGQVVTRTMLLEQVWQLNFDPQTNLVDVHISRLRQKIDRDEETALIHTVRGVGYVLRARTEVLAKHQLSLVCAAGGHPVADDRCGCVPAGGVQRIVPAGQH